LGGGVRKKSSKKERGENVVRSDTTKKKEVGKKSR